MITPDQPVLVGVSGGPDSLCLMHLLHSLDYSTVIAHLDHQLRAESAEEAELVRKMAAEYGQPFVIRQMDIRTFSRKRQVSIEEGARLARYQFLFKEARKNRSRAVLVGHTADDQVETVLMHLLRGAGVSGLAGMSFRSLPNAWSKRIPLLRPLLGVWRDQILSYLDANGLRSNLDTSNLDLRFHRNRLRHELIPYLETFNPNIRQLLWQTADILGHEEEILQKQLAFDWQAVVREHEKPGIAFDLCALRELPLAMRRRVIQKAILILHPEIRDLDYSTIDRAVKFLELDPKHKQTGLLAGLRMRRDRELLWISDSQAGNSERRWPQLPDFGTKKLEIPGKVQLIGGWLLRAEVVERQAGTTVEMKKNPDPFQAWLDLDRLETPLAVRSRRPGDRFQPLGMPDGTIKVSDFMINERLPVAARRNWPLVLSGDRIAWLPGYRPSHAFRITSETKRMIYLRLLKPE